MAAAMGRASLDDAGEEIFPVVDTLGRAHGLTGKRIRLTGILRLPTLSSVTERGSGESQGVVEPVAGRARLSILKCWPHEGGWLTTPPLVHTRHPGTGRPNLGMYRMQVMGTDVTGMHGHRHKTGARHFDEWK